MNTQTPDAPLPTARFARTKIQPPRPRAELVPRTVLETRLAAALAHKRLVLISAPAGFGKTAALTRQIGQLPAGTALAWVSADEDDDLQRLLDCLFTALEPFDLPWRVAPEALAAAVGTTRSQRRAVADALLNTLAAAELPRGLLVFDDMHRIEDPAVFEFLELLIERLPDHWGLVIATRVDPPLPLARWRAGGEAAEFRQDELRFGAGEVRALGHSLSGAEVAPADVELLLTRTGGWAAGLRLALASVLRGQPRGGPADDGIAWSRAGITMDRHLFDYLAAEVLDEMPAALRLFLLRSSVLPELTATRCAGVTADPEAAAHLAEIERRGLFVSALDESETTLRLHDLFRDFLDDRLHRELPHELPQLLARAAAGEPDPLRRVGYLLRAGHWAEAEKALFEAGPAMVASGAVTAVRRLIDQFPVAYGEQAPGLQHLRGYCALAHWDWFGLHDAMQRAADGYAKAGVALAAHRARVRQALALIVMGRIEQAQALLGAIEGQTQDTETEALVRLARNWLVVNAGALDQVAQTLHAMVDVLERSDSPVLWYQCIPITLCVSLPGTRVPLERYVTGAQKRVSAELPTPLRAMSMVLQAGLAAWAGRCDEAAALLHHVEADVRWLGQPPDARTYLLTFTALVHAMRGEREAALAAAQQLIDDLDDERSSGRRAVWGGHLLYLKTRVAAALDDDALVLEMQRHLMQLDESRERALLLQQRSPLAARLAEAAGRHQEAAALYAQALQQHELALDTYGQGNEIRARLAHALLASQRIDDAAEALKPMFGSIDARGEIGGVLLAGQRALAALAAAPWGPRLGLVRVQQLRHWAAQRGAADAAGIAAGAPAESAEADSLLSPREWEVLARIAAGDSNKHIARAFDLSPHTVKRHVANILGKLAVESRGQAAAWWREHATG
jgi:LuxR family maltose regulon positive regulatory protein